MAKLKPITEGQRYLIEWALASDTRMLYKYVAKPPNAPIGVSMSALRGLTRRGLFVEHKDVFFKVQDAAKAYTTLERVNAMRGYFGKQPLESLDFAEEV